MNKNSFEYKAFISYQREDEWFAKWLFNKLEKFSIPASLNIKNSENNKLGKFFRDTEELSTGPSLSEELKKPLDNSEFLIIICSPNSAKSFYVNEEVKYFKTLRKYNIIPIIIDGEPNATIDPIFNLSDEAYVEALRFDVDEYGDITEELANPLAPDIRKGKDSKEKAKTRIIATLLNVKFDILWQREKKRLFKERLIYLLVLVLFLSSVTFGALEFMQKDKLKTSNYQIELLNKSLVDKKAQLLKNISLKDKIKINEDIEQLEKDKIAVVNLQKSFGIYNEEWSIKARNIFDKNGAVKAIEYLDSIESQKDEDKMIQKLADKYRVKAKLYIVNHQYKKAFTVYEKAILYKDSVELLNEYGEYALNQNNITKAIEIFEKNRNKLEVLYKEYPYGWAHDYAGVLNNLGFSYQQENLLDARNKFYNQSLEISEEYYGYTPDEWAHEYTVSLNNLALTYSSIPFAEKALEIRKMCYKQNLDKWAKDYIISLINLAKLYSDKDRLDEAIELQEEALEIVRKYYKKNSDKWVKGYIQSLNNLAKFYMNKNRLDEAIKLQEEALKIIIKLYETNPNRWRPDYIGQLYDLAFSYRKLNQLNEAVKLLEKGVSIEREFYKMNSNRLMKNYSIALTNLSWLYTKLNKLSEAITVQKESLKIVRELYQENPDKWINHYIDALNNLNLNYLNQNKLDKGIELKEECVKILRKYYMHNPSEWRYRFINSLNDLASYYAKQNRLVKVIKLQKEVVIISRKFYKILFGSGWAQYSYLISSTNKIKLDRWIDNYLISLQNLVTSYIKQNQLAKALILQKEAINIKKEYKNNTDKWIKDNMSKD